MNILYIHTNEDRDKEIFEILKKVGATVSEIDAPTPGESNEAYAPRLLTAMEQNGTEVCFCLDYLLFPWADNGGRYDMEHIHFTCEMCSIFVAFVRPHCAFK